MRATARARRWRIRARRPRRSASAVLQLADERMYVDKARNGHDRRAKTRDVLMQLLNERTPDLRQHVNGVGQLVADLARQFARDSDQLDEMLRACAHPHRGAF